MNLTILGCYAATPRTFTNPTAQVLELKNHLFLIDCGEGTQVQLRKSKIKFSRIKHVFISHLHGDHFYGLIGLISTFRLLNRTQELHIFGPAGIKEIILMQLKYADSWTNFLLVFHELVSKGPELILDEENVTVTTIPLNHRIYTNGFLFREKLGERKLNMEGVQKYKVEICDYQNLKNGRDYVNGQNETIPNHLLTFDPPKPKSYAYCSDTVFNPDIATHIKGVDVLYHEATFLDEHQKLAAPTKHSTAKQAAEIARQAEVGKLVLGHFSTRYGSIQPFLEEAQTIFEQTLLADDGKVFSF